VSRSRLCRDFGGQAGVGDPGYKFAPCRITLLELLLAATLTALLAGCC